MVQKKRLCLFDIDGTLVTSPIPCTQGVMEALQTGFDLPFKEVTISPKAATALEVAAEVLTGNGITTDMEGFKEKLEKSQKAYFRIVKAGIENGSFFWKPLPNIIELLKVLSKRDDVKLALLTANPRATVEMKLKSANIDVNLFKERSGLFGAFGCEAQRRSDLVLLAKSRFCKLMGVSDVDPNDMIVIGDTPNDVSCAHTNDVPCVAVATGKYAAKKLLDADCLLVNGFEDVQSGVNALLNTRRCT